MNKGMLKLQWNFRRDVRICYNQFQVKQSKYGNSSKISLLFMQTTKCPIFFLTTTKIP